jgi:hypothetical protein
LKEYPVMMHGVSTRPDGSTNQVPLRADGNGRLAVEPLGIPGVARQCTAGSASANVVLTAGVTRVSVYARGADIRFAVGSGEQTASGTSHFIAQGERLDFDVPANANIAATRAFGVDGVLEISELS